ncbi:MAG: ATP-binding cassette domain-containing protein [Eubacteriales bacterium]|nr:ATP-binding cassette domain-containing protein [Eubacteriales bacterium]MDD4460732.1 ATP-binding cassette domain-containing protein [Eubacteriales bacterium]
MQDTPAAPHCHDPLHPWHQLELENVSVRRGGELILDHISFTLHCGEIVALIGPNGGGKSTLLKALSGEWPYQGKIIASNGRGQILPRPSIGYMPQHLLFDRHAPLTVADLLGAHHSRWPVFLGVRRSTQAQLAELLDLVEARHLLHRQLGQLSGGELQRVTLAFALDPVPDILLLDEPVSALDEKGKTQFYQLVRDLQSRYDLLTLIVSHDLEVIGSYADRLIYLNQRILSSGSSSDLLAGGFLGMKQPPDSREVEP